MPRLTPSVANAQHYNLIAREIREAVGFWGSLADPHAPVQIRALVQLTDDLARAFRRDDEGFDRAMWLKAALPAWARRSERDILTD